MLRLQSYGTAVMAHSLLRIAATILLVTVFSGCSVGLGPPVVYEGAAVDHLAVESLTSGMSRAEVLQLLGEPYSTSKTGDLELWRYLECGAQHDVVRLAGLRVKRHPIAAWKTEVALAFRGDELISHELRRSDLLGVPENAQERGECRGSLR